MKRLKNIEKNQNSNNNDKSNLTSARSESISDDKLERSVYSPDVANMKDINILESKNETQTSFEYLKKTEMCFFLVIQIFLIQI